MENQTPEQKYEDNPEIKAEMPIPANEPQIDFLEVSVISEIIQMVEQIDSKCKGQIGEDIVNERIKQLAYSKILCNVYGKDITYLIKAYTNLGIAYLDIEYYEQAQEHLLNAFKLNETLSKDDNLSMKEYQIKILINLSKCYLEDEKKVEKKDEKKEEIKLDSEKEEQYSNYGDQLADADSGEKNADIDSDSPPKKQKVKDKNDGKNLIPNNIKKQNTNSKPKLNYNIKSPKTIKPKTQIFNSENKNIKENIRTKEYKKNK